MANGNTVSATIASSYGCFWMSFAIILLPSFQIADAYSSVEEFNHAVGLFMVVSAVSLTSVAAESSLGTHTGILHLLTRCDDVFYERDLSVSRIDHPRQLHVALPCSSQSPDRRHG